MRFVFQEPLFWYCLAITWAIWGIVDRKTRFGLSICLVALSHAGVALWLWQLGYGR